MSKTHYIRHCDEPGCTASISIPWSDFMGISPWLIETVSLDRFGEAGWTYRADMRCPKHNKGEPGVRPDSPNGRHTPCDTHPEIS